MCKVAYFFLPVLILHLNHGIVCTEASPDSYLHEHLANASKFNKSNVHFKSQMPNESDYLEEINNFSNLTDWLEDIDPRQKKVPKTFRQTHIEGLQHFKNRVNKAKLKKPKDFSNQDIVGKNKCELDVLTNSNSLVQNFDENIIDLTTEKFKKIHSDYLKWSAEETATETPQPMRRQWSAAFLLKRKKNNLQRILSLMHQFIYQAQDNLLIVQKLRRKYIVNVKYKIGYMFALLRILKQQQLRLYSSMHFYRFYTPDPAQKTYYDVADFMYYLILYEKLTRLDDDIVTAVRHLWSLEDQRAKDAVIEATKFPKRNKMTEGPAEYVYDSDVESVYPYQKVLGT